MDDLWNLGNALIERQSPGLAANRGPTWDAYFRRAAMDYLAARRAGAPRIESPTVSFAELEAPLQSPTWVYAPLPSGTVDTRPIAPPSAPSVPATTPLFDGSGLPNVTALPWWVKPAAAAAGGTAVAYLAWRLLK